MNTQKNTPQDLMVLDIEQAIALDLMAANIDRIEDSMLLQTEQPTVRDIEDAAVQDLNVLNIEPTTALHLMLLAIEQNFQPTAPMPEKPLSPPLAEDRYDPKALNLRSKNQFQHDRSANKLALGYWHNGHQKTIHDQLISKFGNPVYLAQVEQSENLETPGIEVPSMSIANEHRRIIQSYITEKIAQLIRRPDRCLVA